jgi:hypothetical protein
MLEQPLQPSQEMEHPGLVCTVLIVWIFAQRAKTTRIRLIGKDPPVFHDSKNIRPAER